MQALRVLVLMLAGVASGVGVAAAQMVPQDSSASPQQPPQIEQRSQQQQPDQVSVMCLYGILSTSALIGSRCSAGRGHEEVQADLAQSAARLEGYLREHGAAQAVVQIHQQLLSASNRQICNGEPLRMYDVAVSKGSAWVRDLTDQVLSGANHDGCF
jgi:hypothetical protein